jgi:plasmid stabilization system protein ParE
VLNLSFHPEVADEISASYRWYQEQAEGLGDDFLAELESAYQAVVEFPETWPLFHKKFRRYLLPRFPFSVIYREKGDVIFVLAVMHNSRKPGYWSARA